MPTVQVSEYVKDELDGLKDEKDHTSYDSAIREMIICYKMAAEEGSGAI